MSVYLGLDNTAFVFLKNPCHSLPVSPLRLVLMWWYLIWHPSTLPHNPLALQETEIFTASPFCLYITFSFGVLIRRVSVHHNAWMNVRRRFVLPPQAPRTIWNDRRHLQNTYSLFWRCLFFSQYWCQVGIFLFCCRRKESCVILIFDCLISFAVIWYDRACHFYLISVFAIFSSVV